MKKYFGTDGIRARAGDFPLQHRALSVLGSALTRELSSRLNKPVRIVMGGDTRESTPWIGGALAWGIRAAGGDSAWAGVIPTPGIAYLTTHAGFDAGIVISASHNPYHDNGVKIFLPSGAKQDDALEEILEAAIDEVAPAASEQEASAEELELRCSDALSARYIEFLSSEIGAGIDLSKLKLAIDCAHGAASYYARIVFQSLGARTFLMGTEPNGKNINLDCGSLHLEKLGEFVRETGADLGIAVDGDADRCLMTDHTGTPVDGDAMLLLLATAADAKGKLHPRQVIATVMSNLGLEIALRERQIELIRTSVGDRYVLEKLLETGALLGGEQAGHLIFPAISLAGDGMLTALQILRVVTEQQKSLRELAAAFTQFPQVLLNVHVREKVPFESVPAIAETARIVEEYFAGRGRLLLRYSGTEKLARVMIEGEHLEDVTHQAQKLAEVIKAELGA